MKKRQEDAGTRRKEPANGGRRQQRLGGKGLSLEAFAAAKTKPSHNPGQIKKHREFYQNAKKVQKYKKLKSKLESNHEQINDEKPDEPLEKTKPVEGKTNSGSLKHRKTKGFGFFTKLTNEYEKKQKEAEKEKEERARAFAAKQQARQQAEERRKQTKAKMLKKTSRGQPIMKHRLEQILDSFESSRNQLEHSTDIILDYDH